MRVEIFGVLSNTEDEKMSLECSTNSFFSSLCISSVPVSDRLGHQLGHADKVICRSHPPSSQLRSVSSSKTRFPKTSHGLHPTKDLFDPLSNPLTEGIALMTRGSPIDGRSAFALDVGRHMRENLSSAQKTHKTSITTNHRMRDRV